MEYGALWNGIQLPMMALGTYKMSGEALNAAVAAAISSGYRSFDTAAFYQNEADLAYAIAASGEPREELFVTSKVWIDRMSYDETLRSFDESEEKLGKIDMMLVHWPCGKKFLDTWKALERIYDEKRVRAIGVANFLPSHIELLMNHCNVLPAVNQIEESVFYMDQETIAICEKHKIIIEAWRPLLGKIGVNDDPTLTDVAQKHGVTNAQVALRFLTQNHLRVLVKSENPQRIQENIDSFTFDLTDEDMNALKKLSHKSNRVGDDPNVFGVS